MVQIPRHLRVKELLTNIPELFIQVTFSQRLLNTFSDRGQPWAGRGTSPRKLLLSQGTDHLSGMEPAGKLKSLPPFIDQDINDLRCHMGIAVCTRWSGEGDCD